MKSIMNRQAGFMAALQTHSQTYWNLNPLCNYRRGSGKCETATNQL